ncbi:MULTISPECIES: 2'-5' RNA ligase family protein [Comamonas]|uniref:2'-5' RNA ligase family protein n=1 Tax=Comamonas TaxID=283 RepID=UPI0015FBB15E|nr:MULTISPECIES: 2'-5' RNA ligase family protein [Comamonas]UUC95132.1 2'-5' RNA ligase family protein [Comamonas sp. C11]WEE79170.1 2'-5' RNA ligase family protein [Comamonas testosteroni]
MSQARMLIVTQPHSPVRHRLRAGVNALGLDRELGERLFSPDNWHQTWCGPFDSGQEALLALLAAGNAVQAAQLKAFELSFDRIHGEVGERIHWSLRTRERPEPFKQLPATLQTELKSQGFKDGGHRPHITISYRALHALPTRRIDPVDWLVDEIQLVERTGTGKQLRYQVLHRWPLACGSPPHPQQLRLFH